MNLCGCRVTGLELQCAGRCFSGNAGIPVNAHLASHGVGLSGAPVLTGKSVSRECPPAFSHRGGPGGAVIGQRQPNQRMKLSWRGGRLERNCLS